MIKKFTSMSSAALMAVCLLLTVLLTAGINTKNYMAEKSARAAGRLTETILTDEDFVTESMRSRAPEKGLKATDGDPQMIYTGSMEFTGIKFYMEYIVYPGEMLLYYSTTPDCAYGNDKMVVISPVKGQPGWFYADLPLTQVTSIRIDPTVVAGNHLVFGDFVLNPQKSLADYMAVDAYTMLSVAMYTIVLYVFLSFVKDFFTKWGK